MGQILLLAIIYLSFISLGLPDSLLGSVWPIMQEDLTVPLSYAGIITFIISVGTISSSLYSDKMTRKFSSGIVTVVSVLLTAIALFGFSISNSFIMLCLFAIPYGIGAGGVDATLNNYAALHLSSRHMSWLHASWGIGASIGPSIMGFALTNHLGWTTGYQMIAVLQVVLTFVIFMSLPLWNNKNSEDKQQEHKSLTMKEVLHIKGVKLVIITFFSYCALEATAGLWATTYLVKQHQVAEEIATNFAALFFLGITVGRFLSGFIAGKLSDKTMIRLGLGVILFGTFLIPLNSSFALVGLVVVGFGCAPIYPAIIHSTPLNFGSEHSGSIIGIQIACAYAGSTIMSPLFGVIAEHISVSLYPIYLLLFVAIMIVSSEILNSYLKNRER